MPAYISENEGSNMKTITLVLNRIRQFAVKNKIVFILFIIGGVLNSIIFTYLYGHVRPVMRNSNSTDYYYRRYEVIFSWQDVEAPDGSIGGCIIISPEKNYVTEEDNRHNGQRDQIRDDGVRRYFSRKIRNHILRQYKFE